MPADAPELLHVFAAAFFGTLLSTPAVRRLALRLGWLAVPGHRSVHRRPVPYLGGLALYAGFAAAVLLGLGIDDPLGRVVVVGAAATVLWGALDDRLDLPPGLKLAGMAAVAVGTALAGVRIEWMTNPLGGIVQVPAWVAVPLTAFWIVALMNVMNLTDGLDGLAAGIAAIASLTLLLTALKHPQPAIASVGTLLSTAVLGSSLGFLPFNFNPARIFMGDAGSLFLGYVLAVTSVAGALKSATVLALAVPVLVLGLPILDTVLSIVRRLRDGRPISEADREHLHHRLLDLGLTHREAVVVMYLLSGWLGVGALVLADLSALQATLVLALAGTTLYLLAKKVGFGSREGKKLRQNLRS